MTQNLHVYCIHTLLPDPTTCGAGRAVQRWQKARASWEMWTSFQTVPLDSLYNINIVYQRPNGSSLSLPVGARHHKKLCILSKIVVSYIKLSNRKIDSSAWIE